MKDSNNPGGKTHLRHVMDACSALKDEFTYSDVEHYIRVKMKLRQVPCAKGVQNIMKILEGQGKIEYVKEVDKIVGYRNTPTKIKQYRWVK